MPWRELSCVIPRELAEELGEILEARGAQAITFAEADGEELFEPPPGETPLWRQVRLTALFDLETEIATLCEELSARFALKWQSNLLADQPWERVWLEHFKPLDFGRLWICPTGQSPADPNAISLTLDPGLAFGTGTHPTTALCLEWLVEQDLAGKTVLDYGCGSGILAIAALKLGAEQAIACDIDPQALLATQENARKNRVERRLLLCSPQTLPAVSVDLLLANILADPLIALAPTLTACLHPGGQLILSGLLEAQAGKVKQAYLPSFRFAPPKVKQGWVLLAGLRV